MSLNDGTIMEIEGHKALIPISVTDTTGNPLRPNDSLPLAGPKVRAQLFKDITKIADQIGATLPNLHRLLPPSLWVESGTNSRHVDAKAQRISDSHYVRIVVKGVGVMWGFCKHWMWGVVESFLASEGYVSTPEGQHDVLKRIHNIIDKNGTDRDPAGRLAYLYLVGKAKSLLKNRWLWRPIATLPRPLLPKKELTVAARATTTFLRLIAEEVPGNFMVHSVNQVAEWFHWLPSIQFTWLGWHELDRKDQFNHVPPSKVQEHRTASSAWLAKKRRWRMTEVCWSIHRDSKKLDRARRGASGKFWYIDHQQLSEKINFKLQNNNYVLAAGKFWQRTGCIPMGGPFLAQAADLHCQWGVYTCRGKFRDLGDLRISDAGFVY